MSETFGPVPHLTVSDAAAAIAFYVRAFGAEEVARLPAEDGVRLMHAELRINGGRVFLCDHFEEFSGGPIEAPAAVALHLHVGDADAWQRRAEAAGATVVMPVADMFWGDRYGRVRDPFGHTWSLGTTPKA